MFILMFFLRLFNSIEKRAHRKISIYRLLYKPIVAPLINIVLMIGLVLVVVIILIDSRGSKSDELVRNLIEMTTLVTVIFTAGQVIVARDVSKMEVSNKLLDDDKQIRKKSEEAKHLSDDYYENYYRLECSKDFDSIRQVYYNDKYKSFREYAYHYECLGQIIYRDQINFRLVFDTVSFPDDVFEVFLMDIDEFSKKRPDSNADQKNQWNNYISSSYNKEVDIDNLVDAIRIITGVPDMWLGVEYLYRTYELKRAFNKLMGESTIYSKKNDVYMNYKKCKENWKKTFDKMPV